MSPSVMLFTAQEKRLDEASRISCDGALVGQKNTMQNAATTSSPAKPYICHAGIARF
ncbi:hypothetical protein RLDS_19510 [Sphingobium lactosutens DS20]|uniref:Uncharacterized protein n=1 Tax=Sphingobium lactosutens DS20 TaxID=1331060 RepID=T0H7S3_9SPHN|nr:hypothetical protein RLDS_19510 [Sphingobium lactosutens DS20]